MPRTTLQYKTDAKRHDPERIAEILMDEAGRTASQASKVLVKDVNAGSQQVDDPQMLRDVKAGWSNPQFRADLLQSQSPRRVIDWYLRAFDVGMTVAQYEKMLQADTSVVPGYDKGPNTGAPEQPKVEEPAPPMPPMAPPMAPPPMAPPPMMPPPELPMAPPPPDLGAPIQSMPMPTGGPM